MARSCTTTVTSVLLAVACLSEIVKAANRPVISVQSGKVMFTSSPKQDIVFQPGLGGNILLNGINIKNKSDLVGPKGLKGDIGPAGLQGKIGPAGPIGPKGVQGIQGAQGIQGPLGPKGAVGAKGEAGSPGPQGIQGNAGDRGPKGEPGPPGESASNVAEQRNLLPSYPFWLNLNATKLPAYGGGLIEMALSGFSGLYSPSFQPSYTCRFMDSMNNTATSRLAPVSTRKDGITGMTYYVVNCPVAAWTYPLANVSISLWFQDRIEVPFMGIAGTNKVEFFVTWHRVHYQRGNRSLIIFGQGFNPNVQYVCNFTDPKAVARGHSIYSPPRNPTTTTMIIFPVPAWNLTGDSRIEIPTFVSLIENHNNTLPYVGNTTGNNFRFFRCEDGVKNGAETDVDCGGLCASGCGRGKSCTRVTDCSTKLCIRGTCQSYRNCQDRYNAGTRSNGLYEIDVYANSSLFADIWCDFSTGKGVNVAGDGSRPILAAWSCKQIRDYFPLAKTGYRYLRFDNGSAFKTYRSYCDMDIDGGGWTIVIRGTLDSTYQRSLNKSITSSKGFMYSFGLVRYRDIMVKYGNFATTTRWVYWKNTVSGRNTLEREMDNYGEYYNRGPTWTRSSSYGSSSMRSVSETYGLTFKKTLTYGPNTQHFFVVGYSGYSSCCDYYSDGCRRVDSCFSVSLGYRGHSGWSNPSWKRYGFTTSCGYAGYYYTSTGNCQSSGAIFIR